MLVLTRLEELWCPHPNGPNERGGPDGEDGWGWKASVSEGDDDAVGVVVTTGASKQLPEDLKVWIRQRLERLVDQNDPRTPVQQLVDASPIELLVVDESAPLRHVASA